MRSAPRSPPRARSTDEDLIATAVQCPDLRARVLAGLSDWAFYGTPGYRGPRLTPAPEAATFMLEERGDPSTAIEVLRAGAADARLQWALADWIASGARRPTGRAQGTGVATGARLCRALHARERLPLVKSHFGNHRASDGRMSVAELARGVLAKLLCLTDSEVREATSGRWRGKPLPRRAK